MHFYLATRKAGRIKKIIQKLRHMIKLMLYDIDLGSKIVVRILESQEFESLDFFSLIPALSATRTSVSKVATRPWPRCWTRSARPTRCS